MEEIGQRIKDRESWLAWWSKKAQSYEAAGKLEPAWIYYRAALFYLPLSDPRKEALYHKFTACFYEYYRELDFGKYDIPYRQGFLPALYLRSPQARRTLLVFGGFDSYLEELASWLFKLQQDLPDYNLLIFDGPGQGHVPAQGIYFQADYEEAVSSVLDYFALEEVAAVGVSWGGYFVLRAAAFEKRIKQLVAFDIFYSPMDTMRLAAGWPRYLLLRTLLGLRQKWLMNRVMEAQAKKRIDFHWFLTNGYDVTGEDNPYDFIRNIQRHSLKGILPQVRQTCLLLAGSQDMYVPVSRLKTIRQGLIQASRIESRLFTADSGGVLHCQIDRVEAAMAVMREFLEEEID